MDRDHAAVVTTIKYSIIGRTIKQEMHARASKCSLLNAEITVILFALDHAKNVLRQRAPGDIRDRCVPVAVWVN